MQQNLSKVLANLLLGLLFIFVLTSCNKEKQANKAAPSSIQVVEVIQKDVPIYDLFVGQVYGQEDVSINARVEGYLTGIFI